MRIVTIVAVLALAVAVQAGPNPDVTIYISFSSSGPPVHVVDVEPYTLMNAYLCLGNITGGVGAAAFRLSNPAEECPGMFVGLVARPVLGGP